MIPRILILLCLSALLASAQAVIKLGTLAPRGSSVHKLLMEMRQKWQQAPAGGVALTIYPGTMGDDMAMVSRMQVNQLQAAVLTVVGLSQIESSVSALMYMPMMFRSLDEVDYIQRQLQPDLEKKLNAKGYVVLFWGDLGWVRLFSKTPVARPADLKKLRIFTWSGDPKTLDIMKALGFQPVPLEPNDTLANLQSGLISAVPLPPMYAVATQVNTVAPYMIELNYAPLVGGAVVTRKAWDALPPATREALLNAARQTGGEMRARNRSESDKAVAEMKQRGLKVQAVTPELEAEWRQVAEQAYPHIRGSIVPADTFDEVRRLLADYRAGRKK